MFVITQEQCLEVAGGNQSNAGASQTTQVCSGLPNGGAQCTSSNGSSMVVTTYDSSGNLTSTMSCTANGTASAGAGAKKIGIQFEASAGGGSTCTRTGSGVSPTPSTPASGARRGVLAIEHWD